MLNLLLFCHKYVIHPLQNHVKILLQQLEETDALRAHLAGADHGDLTISHVLEVATAVHNEAMISSARRLVIEETWKTREDRDDTLFLNDIYNVLAFGERVADQEIVGCAYYQILRSKPHEAPWDTRLSAQQISILERARLILSKEWEDIFMELGIYESDTTYARNHRGRQQTLIHAFWVRLAEARLLPYDVVGRLQLLLAVRKEVGGANPILEPRWLTMHERIHVLFLPSQNIEQ